MVFLFVVVAIARFIRQTCQSDKGRVFHKLLNIQRFFVSQRDKIGTRYNVTTTTLAQIKAVSSCCSDSGNKRFSEKLEIAPRKLNH